MDRGAWRARVYGITKTQTQLGDEGFHFSPYILCLHSLSVLQQVSELHSFLRLNNILNMWIVNFLYPFICQWTFGLLLRFGYLLKSLEHVPVALGLWTESHCLWLIITTALPMTSALLLAQSQSLYDLATLRCMIRILSVQWICQVLFQFLITIHADTFPGKSLLFEKLYLFMHLFLAGSRCTWAFSSWGEQGATL